MNYLGIDYGLKNVGLSISSDSPLAEPLDTIKNKSLEQLVATIVRLLDENSIDKVVIGLPEGKIKSKVEEFRDYLQTVINAEIILWNEDYSTKQAQFQARQARKTVGKIKSKEHSWAATVILQNYLEKDKNLKLGILVSFFE